MQVSVGLKCGVWVGVGCQCLCGGSALSLSRPALVWMLGAVAMTAEGQDMLCGQAQPLRPVPCPPLHSPPPLQTQGGHQ